MPDTRIRWTAPTRVVVSAFASSAAIVAAVANRSIVLLQLSLSASTSATLILESDNGESQTAIGGALSFNPAVAPHAVWPFNPYGYVETALGEALYATISGGIWNGFLTVGLAE